jgi:uncharacterized membrane protein YsdA (DUF1294 family)
MNLVAFGFHSPAVGPRVPQPVRLLITVVGGGLGAFSAMHFFRRPALPGGQRWLVWGTAALQAALIVWLIWMMW